MIEREGLASTAEIGPESLARRLEAVAVELGCQVIEPTQYGAWVTQPA